MADGSQKRDRIRGTKGIESKSRVQDTRSWRRLRRDSKKEGFIGVRQGFC